MATGSGTSVTSATAARWPIAAFAATILLGAFLLFQVQPVVSKAILPWFGGCPAVWTTCLLFFETLLFGGYLYAHLLQRWLRPRRQAAVHLVLVAAALAALPIVPGPRWKPADASNPTWQILLLLGATVGLPYFALSATSPLVQAWFSRAFPGRSPYRLYALSNFGSLAALLSYPFLVEPALDLSGQSATWGSAFVLYAALCAVSLACVWRCGRDSEPSSDPPRTLGTEVPSPRSALRSPLSPLPSSWDRFRWLALPALGSLMLLAATNHICQDVAVVPFLWVMPLALYLVSFIVSFDHPRWYVRPVWAGLCMLALAAAAFYDYLLSTHTRTSLLSELPVYLGALLFACMVCHGELARLKPHPRHLTEFYLLISAGGALGGLLVAIVAPLVFQTYFEWHIGLAACFVLSGGLLVLPLLKCRRGILPRCSGEGPDSTSGGKRQDAASTGLSPVSRRLLRYATFVYLLAPALVYLALWSILLGRPVDRARNFFGVVAVIKFPSDPKDPAPPYYLLRNGRITHGCQFLDPEKSRWPTTYYGEGSGVGQAIRYLQKSGPLRLGAIGLGAGTIAAYAQPGDTFRFYEINPAVLRIARRRFTYLSECRGESDVVLGDARLSLEAEPPQHYRLLVIDAFSGDAIPTHLLTREAFEVYRRHLHRTADGVIDGVIAVHVSNTYLRSAPVVRRLAENCGMKAVRINQSCDDDEEARLMNSNEWVLVTCDEGFLRANPSEPAHDADDDLKVPLWTDQYSNLFEILSSR